MRSSYKTTQKTQIGALLNNSSSQVQSQSFLFSIHSKKRPFISNLTQSKQFLQIIHQNKSSSASQQFQEYFSKSKNNSLSYDSMSNQKRSFPIQQYKDFLKGQRFYIEVYFKGKQIFSGYEPYIQAMGGEITKRLTNTTTIILTNQLTKAQYQKIKKRKDTTCPTGTMILSILWIQQIYRQKKKVSKQEFIFDESKDIIDAQKQEDLFPQMPDYFYQKIVQQAFVQKIDKFIQNQAEDDMIFQIIDQKKVKKIKQGKINSTGCVIIHPKKCNLFKQGQFDKLKQNYKYKQLNQFIPIPKKDKRANKKNNNNQGRQSQRFLAIMKPRQPRKSTNINKKKQKLSSSFDSFDQVLEDQKNLINEFQNKSNKKNQEENNQTEQSQKYTKQNQNEQNQSEFFFRIKRRSEKQTFHGIFNKFPQKLIEQKNKQLINNQEKITSDEQNTFALSNIQNKQKNIESKEFNKNLKTKNAQNNLNSPQDSIFQSNKLNIKFNDSINSSNSTRTVHFNSGNSFINDSPNHQINNNIFQTHNNIRKKTFQTDSQQFDIQQNQFQQSQSLSLQNDDQNMFNSNNIYLNNKEYTKQSIKSKKYNQNKYNNRDINKSKNKNQKVYDKTKSIYNKRYQKDLDITCQQIQQIIFNYIYQFLQDIGYYHQQLTTNNKILRLNFLFSKNNSIKVNKFIKDYNKKILQKYFNINDLKQNIILSQNIQHNEKVFNNSNNLSNKNLLLRMNSKQGKNQISQNIEKEKLANPQKSSKLSLKSFLSKNTNKLQSDNIGNSKITMQHNINNHNQKKIKVNFQYLTNEQLSKYFKTTNQVNNSLNNYQIVLLQQISLQKYLNYLTKSNLIKIWMKFDEILTEKQMQNFDQKIDQIFENRNNLFEQIFKLVQINYPDIKNSSQIYQKMIRQALINLLINRKKNLQKTNEINYKHLTVLKSKIYFLFDSQIQMDILLSNLISIKKQHIIEIQFVKELYNYQSIRDAMKSKSLKLKNNLIENNQNNKIEVQKDMNQQSKNSKIYNQSDKNYNLEIPLKINDNNIQYQKQLVLKNYVQNILIPKHMINSLSNHNNKILNIFSNTLTYNIPQVLQPYKITCFIIPKTLQVSFIIKKLGGQYINFQNYIMNVPNINNFLNKKQNNNLNFFKKNTKQNQIEMIEIKQIKSFNYSGSNIIVNNSLNGKNNGYREDKNDASKSMKLRNDVNREKKKWQVGYLEFGIWVVEKIKENILK